MDLRPKKKLPRMAEGQTGEDEGGDDGTVWVWIAFASEPRLILALVVGPRTQTNADELITRTASVLVGRLPLFVSDGLNQYGTALLERWHVEVPYPHTGKRGRPRKPAKVAQPDLRYAQVVKKRKGRRIESVTKRVVYGEAEQIEPSDICTSLIERINLTLRQENATLNRKTLSFAKDEDELRAHLAFQVAYYNFVRPHMSLREATVDEASPRRWDKRTPAMAAKLTDHVWSLRELLTYRLYKTATN